ncbi:50S ribosomal protein L5 [Candidatus Beckwithbacteria bacterium RBG_13_42_9]|uniref:Large ribosomal subunit protein uL5 n=1 Tax=Candidatus Beckwithbacteria bacterium RBG_13_42_9 TaxID=1797457 RepID=A0A1F5E999_9BACT|nr:MAG: 50S ribosomal protein L5 [Candidatus Beckwithbacteria bacterium RBG_13_42_9]
MDRLYQEYQKKIVPALQKELKKTNYLAVPRVEKVIVNVGIGDLARDKKTREKSEKTIMLITGQKPQLRLAKKAIADFKIRRGDVIGLKVTLRSKRAFEFLDKLFSIVLPRVRDFQGVSSKGFDGSGNYTLGLTEQVIFPEVDYDTIDRVRGLEITIVTNTKDDKEARTLLKALGMPFEKDKE